MALDDAIIDNQIQHIKTLELFREWTSKVDTPETKELALKCMDEIISQYSEIIAKEF